ncbi:MAG: FtsX-like permease family protein [Deltaproteobacteria bacterium]|nr:FtsX-like permease family protein [Deltaproteobacteria bacterium]
MNHLGYYLRRTLAGFRSEWGTNLATVLTLSVAFVLVGSLATVALSLGNQVERWGGADQFQVTAYLRPDAPAAEVAQLGAALEAMPEVRAVRHVPGDQARQRLVEAFPEEQDAWTSLDASFFPGYVEIGLDPSTADEAHYRQLVERVQKLSIVQQVETHGDWYTGVLGIHRAARVLAIALGSLAIFATIFVVAHTIRLNFYRRKRQVEVLRMCGATPWFVRVPFLLEGLFGSVLAAGIALGAIALFVATVRDRLVNVAPVLGQTPIQHLPAVVWAGFVVGAAAIGLTGAWLSVGKALKA